MLERLCSRQSWAMAVTRLHRSAGNSTDLDGVKGLSSVDSLTAIHRDSPGDSPMALRGSRASFCDPACRGLIRTRGFSQLAVDLEDLACVVGATRCAV